MPKDTSLWRSPKGNVLISYALAIIDVILFIGLPSIKSTQVLIATLFLLFIFFNARAFLLQAERIEQLTDPPFTFVASYSSTRQRILGTNAFCRRVGITNDSDVVAKDCELVLASCSADIPGLTPDTALPVKDGGGIRKTDINPGDTKHFDVFYTFLVGLTGTATEHAYKTIVCAPNEPEIGMWPESKEVIIFRLVGSNFEPRIWNADAVVGDGDARITRLEPLASDT